MYVCMHIYIHIYTYIYAKSARLNASVRVHLNRAQDTAHKQKEHDACMEIRDRFCVRVRGSPRAV